MSQPTALWLGDGGLLRWDFGYYDGGTATPNLALHTASVTKNGGGTLLSFTYGYDDAGNLNDLVGSVGAV